MLERLVELKCKVVRYLFLPLQFPRQFFTLWKLAFTQRGLPAELLRLLPQRRWFAGSGICTVIDVGANTGPFAFAIRQLLPEAQLYSFEPLPDCHARLVQNLAPFGRFEAFCTALGDHSGEVTFYRSSFAESSSMLKMGDLHKQAFPFSAGSSEVTVPLARLDDYLTRMELRGPVLLKIDVQGAEDQVLRGAEQTLAQVDYVMTEVSYRPLYEGQVLFDGMYRLLSERGFHYAGSLESLLSPEDGSILQSDALFVRVKG